MYSQTYCLNRIDSPTLPSQSSQLYQPLRKSLLRTNLSQSNISSRSNLDLSRVNDLSSSRVSRRMRSLSPEQAQIIKNNVYVPVNKRLVPTKDLELVKNKRFEAIDMEEKYYKPIPAIKFNSVNRWNINKVEEVVYQTEDQLQARSSNFRNGPTVTMNGNTVNLSMLKAERNGRTSGVINYGATGNIYTSRANDNFQSQSSRQQSYNMQPSMQSHYQAQREYSPREAYNMGLDSRRVQNLNGPSFPYPAPLQLSSRREYSPRQVYEMGMGSRPIDNFQNGPQIPHSFPPLQTESSYNPGDTQNSFMGNGPHTSFAQNLVVNSSNGVTETFNPSANRPPQLNSPAPTFFNPATSQCNPIRQMPTQNTLSFISPLGSRTSFELEKMGSQVSKGYDFSKLTNDDSISQYQSKKKEEFKYNLFSVFDQPLNTGCSKTGCFKNQIVASKPNIYQWQQ